MTWTKEHENLPWEIFQGPLAVKLAKIAIAHGSEMELNNGLRLEQQCYGQVKWDLPSKKEFKKKVEIKPQPCCF